jgi:hypothetical protein
MRDTRVLLLPLMTVHVWGIYDYERRLELFYIICILLRTSVRTVLSYLYIIMHVG